MIYAYARVSTTEQCLDRQTDALIKFGVDMIFKEKMSGTKKNRPELDRLMNVLQTGDTVVVESLSRLGRSVKNLSDAEKSKVKPTACRVGDILLFVITHVQHNVNIFSKNS